MTTINHECYVSLEVAKLLEKAGFDWGSFKSYIVGVEGEMPTSEEGCLITTNYVNVNWLVKAPSLEVAQRWLREVKGNDVEVISVQASDTKRLFVEYDVVIKKNGTLIWPDLYESLKSGVYPICSHARTYEEALEAGIKKALEIILEKGE